MASTFDTKFEALLDKVPQSVMDTPWKRTLFWIMYGVAAIAALLLVVIFGLLKGIFEEGGKTSHHYAQPDEESPDANGYKPGDFFYSKPGTMNPALLNMWEEMDKADDT